MNKEDFFNTKWDARDWTYEMKEAWLKKMLRLGCFIESGLPGYILDDEAGFYIIRHDGSMDSYPKHDGRFGIWEQTICTYSFAFPEALTEQEQSESATPTASDLLSQGAEILNQRGAEYESDGNQERSFDSVAAAFNAITGKDLTAAEVALVLQCVKDVRQWSQDRLHEDSVIDGINYAALKGELLHKQYGEGNEK